MIQDVLIVDESSYDAGVISNQIKEVNRFSNITVVSTYNEYLNYLDSNIPDVIISEYRFKNTCGMDIFDHAKALLSDVLFIYVTNAFQSNEIAMQTVLADADGFVLKCNIKKLQKLVSSCQDRESSDRFGLMPDYIVKKIDCMSNFISQIKRENEMHINSCEQLKIAMQNPKMLS